MSKPLIILGAGALAVEIFDLISEIPGYEVSAFVENINRDLCGTTLENRPIVWISDIHQYSKSHLAICAVGSTKKHNIIREAENAGLHFAALIHPSARVSARATIDEGSFVSALCVVSAYTQIGKHVFLNRGALIGHHTTIGDYCSIQCGVNIAGRTQIGNKTYIGMGAIIADGISIGEGCLIGAGSLALKDLPDRVEAYGSPARITRTDIEEH